MVATSLEVIVWITVINRWFEKVSDFSLSVFNFLQSLLLWLIVILLKITNQKANSCQDQWWTFQESYFCGLWLLSSTWRKVILFWWYPSTHSLKYPFSPSLPVSRRWNDQKVLDKLSITHIYMSLTSVSIIVSCWGIHLVMHFGTKMHTRDSVHSFEGKMDNIVSSLSKYLKQVILWLLEFKALCQFQTFKGESRL